MASNNVNALRSLDGGDDDTKRKRRAPADKSYCITKELLMTERTFKKDLEVITQSFQNAVNSVMPDYLSHLMFSTLCPIYNFHCNFIRNIEQRIISWEGKYNTPVSPESQKIGNVLLELDTVLPIYRTYLDRLEEMLSELELTLKRNREFEQLYKEFEAEKTCYLPLNTFLLKPGQRLLHYRLILERLLKHYNQDHPDYKNCQEAHSHILEVINLSREKMQKVDNLQKLIELQRDLVGIDSLIHPDREFIREGCLQKFSRKGYQQRMFFLFSDMLIYTSRTATSLLQFKVHGQLPLRGMMVEESDISKVAVANSFTIYGGNKCILVAASSEEEKDKWIEDLNFSISMAKKQTDDRLKYGSIRSTTSSNENVSTTGSSDIDKLGTSPPSPEKQIQHRGNTTMHVCWHRNTSVSMRDHDKAVKNQLSGYLLRKFKTSNGWQKLWVVFTNFCLFFYKTYQDEFPLASLPLLGYAVNIPSEEDKITKDHVFKLQFKNHVYFFRAESEYTFQRWIEVVKCATSSARRLRVFSRMESEQGAEKC
ncbi:FERM, ARHGEF and pleckstrin domain-containing protein 2 isoform X2 [Octopus sinensis]|uniref:FERM, ARHGEF and pleckstrin domain-containing protein 2 isoform X2 n=1 Tax=Octopus sinensis TaxID=2607531 RepID=A0A6P7TEZ6_9MOLL|nr:FERM, ARHGEF and pleckstrin domain-containing protein 2 isoform X2 [Octopus sinensis]